MATDSFYANLPVLKTFLQVANPKKYVPVPSDWLIVVTDIIGSTKAIEQGHYKTVNLLGASSITAVLNVAGELDLPFVFGGDGATLLIPITLLSQVKRSLLAVQSLAREEFSMNLRVGIVPVVDVVAAQYRVDIAKLKVSPNYSQSVFIGGGLTYATELVKDPATSSLYTLAPDIAMPKADFSGLECRWQDIPSPHGETVSLLVLAKQNVYQEVIEKIQLIYGDDRANPITHDRLHLNFDSTALLKETKIRAPQKNRFGKLKYLIKIQLENWLGWLLMKFKLNIGSMEWGNYKQIVAEATDYRKLDDVLRMVISGNSMQRQQLTDYLEEKTRSNHLTYGLHVSDRALLTCLVYERNGRQVHFVDGADGGYALAAKAMKARIKVETRDEK
ncbi:MAG: DUF3095 domain-containing protein [Leptolyngbyaceae cyanobacterium CSU_1_3]|nr:DUF3095 domain-containing protein [Leptolyngbyaceae cyanobacterium CSU_1_3]